MQQTGRKLKAAPGPNFDVPKNGLTAMIAATNSNGCVTKHVLLKNQVEVGQRIVKGSFENGAQHPNLHAYSQALNTHNNNILYQGVRILQSSPNPIIIYIQNNNLSVEVNYEGLGSRLEGLNSSACFQG